jgi:hypothetical protein
MPQVLDPPVRRGRAVGWRKPPIPSRQDSSGCTYSVERWCRDADLSKTLLYALFAGREGPRNTRIGGRRLIIESPREYTERLSRERSTSSDDTLATSAAKR